MASPPVLTTELHDLIRPDLPLDLIAVCADHVLSLYPCGRQRLLIYPPPDQFQTPASMPPHHWNIPPFYQHAFPAPSRF